ncbi:MAG: hypothetical protein N2C14_00780 [Planctomycetales bacterium]
MLHLVALLGVCLAVQLWTSTQAATLALDAVKFAACAQSIESQGLLRALREHDLHPLFPTWLWAVHFVLAPTISGVLGTDLPVWATSLKIASTIPLVLCLIPLFWMLRRLHDSETALAGGILFCVLPQIARLGAEGLPDSFHLLFFLCAAAALAEFFVRANEAQDASRSQDATASGLGWPLLVGCGGAIGLACLARLETLVLVPAAVCVLLLGHGFPSQRPLRRRILECAALAAGMLLFLAPYVAATGKILPKHGVQFSFADSGADRVAEHRSSSPVPNLILPDGSPMAFPKKETTVSSRRYGILFAAREFVGELFQAFGYWGGLLAIHGWIRMRRSRVPTFDLVAFVFLALFTVIAVAYAARSGYLSGRHLSLVVVLGLGCAGRGALELGRSLASWPRIAASESLSSKAAWSPLALAVIMMAPHTLQPLHASHEGHRRASEWLAAASIPGDKVLDTHGWTLLHSGRTTYLYETAREAMEDPNLRWFVLEAKELTPDSARARTLRHVLDAAGSRVASFGDPLDRDERRANAPPTDKQVDRVLVFRWNPDRWRSLRTATTTH